MGNDKWFKNLEVGATLRTCSYLLPPAHQPNTSTGNAPHEAGDAARGGRGDSPNAATPAQLGRALNANLDRTGDGVDGGAKRQSSRSRRAWRTALYFCFSTSLAAATAAAR
jgi:hypothetical protein